MVRVGGSTRILGKLLPKHALPPQEVMDLLGEMYETLLREDRWPDVLAHLAELFDAADAAFIEWTGDIDEVRYFVSGRRVYSPESETLYLNHYGLLDSARNLARGTPAGAAANCVDFFPDSFVASDEYYQGFLVPHRLRYRCAIKALGEPDAAAALFLFRHPEQGPFGFEHMQLLGHLDSHVRRLAKLHYELRRLRSERKEALDLLDRLSFGIATATSDGRVRTVNRVAGRLLSAGDGLSLVQGVLDAGVQERTVALRALLAAACKPAGKERSREGAMRVTRPSGKAPYVVVVSPSRGGSSLAPPTALVSISDPDLAPPLSGRQLVELYGLTQAEARLACDLAEGRTPEQVAEIHGVAISTVRSQLSAVLRKCDTPRQVDLIRLLCRITAVGT